MCRISNLKWYQPSEVTTVVKQCGPQAKINVASIYRSQYKKTNVLLYFFVWKSFWKLRLMSSQSSTKSKQNYTTSRATLRQYHLYPNISFRNFYKWTNVQDISGFIYGISHAWPWSINTQADHIGNLVKLRWMFKFPMPMQCQFSLFFLKL